MYYVFCVLFVSQDINRRTSVPMMQDIFYNVKESNLIVNNNYRNRNVNNLDNVNNVENNENDVNVDNLGNVDIDDNKNNGNINDEVRMALPRVLFCELALDILGKDSTTGQLEGSFSGVRVVHTKFRNKLGKERLRKLLYIWFNKRRLSHAGLI